MRNTPYKYIPLVSPVWRMVKTFVKKKMYKGDAVQCSVCEQRFARWAGTETTAQCLNCGSLTRHKFLFYNLRTHVLQSEKALTTLYFAPDPGLLDWLRNNPSIELFTTDYSAPNVDFHWDITDIPAPDDGYDVILCSHVLEHVPADLKAMSELRRILRPDGVLFLQVPYAREAEHTDEDPGITDPDERLRRFGQFDHVRLYGRDIQARLESAGFAVTATTVSEMFSDTEMVGLGLWDDTIFVCR